MGKKRRISLSPKTAAVSVACLALALAALAAAAFFVPKANRKGISSGKKWQGILLMQIWGLTHYRQKM